MGFHADTFEGPRAALLEGVEDCLETCDKLRRNPQRAFLGQMMFRVKPEVQRKALLAAELAGERVNQWGEEVLGNAAW